jgi:hypothetical protein
MPEPFRFRLLVRQVVLSTPRGEDISVRIAINVRYGCHMLALLKNRTSQSTTLCSYDVVCGLDKLVSLTPRHLQLSPGHFEILRSDVHGPVCVF